MKNFFEAEVIDKKATKVSKSKSKTILTRRPIKYSTFHVVAVNSRMRQYALDNKFKQRFNDSYITRT